MPLEKIHDIAFETIRDSLTSKTEPVLDRIDIRKNKGILKFTFSNTYLEIQLDGVSGKTLSIVKEDQISLKGYTTIQFSPNFST